MHLCSSGKMVYTFVFVFVSLLDLGVRVILNVQTEFGSSPFIPTSKLFKKFLFWEKFVCWVRSLWRKLFFFSFVSSYQLEMASGLGVGTCVLSQCWGPFWLRNLQSLRMATTRFLSSYVCQCCCIKKVLYHSVLHKKKKKKNSKSFLEGSFPYRSFKHIL